MKRKNQNQLKSFRISLTEEVVKGLIKKDDIKEAINVCVEHKISENRFKELCCIVYKDANIRLIKMSRDMREIYLVINKINLWSISFNNEKQAIEYVNEMNDYDSNQWEMKKIILM